MKHFGIRSSQQRNSRRPEHAFLSLAVLAAAMLITPAISHADSAKYPLKGLLKSGAGGAGAATPFVAVDDAAEPLTAMGTSSVFVMQQICCATSGTQTTVQVAETPTFSTVILQLNQFTSGCAELSPGVVVSEGSDVYVQGTTQPISCTVSGVVTKAR